MQNANNKYLNTNIYFNQKSRRALGSPVCAMQELGTASAQSLCCSNSVAAQDRGGLLDPARQWQRGFPVRELEHSAHLCQCL